MSIETTAAVHYDEHGVGKADVGKPRMELLPPHALAAVARVLTYGAAKYGDHNWRGGTRHGRYIGALLRHVMAWLAGEDRDPDTGEHHLAHAACCCLFALDCIERGVGEDDRYGGRP